MQLLLILNILGLSAAANVARLVNRQDTPSKTATAAEDTDLSASPLITCTINNDPSPRDLPITSFSKGALPVTLSQAQATDLATFEGTTTEKAAIVATAAEGEDKSTFTTEIVIGPGGFFWVAEPMDGFIWHALPPQEPPPLPTVDCYNFGDVYETSCPREGEGEGGGAEAGSDNGNGGDPPAGPITGEPQPGQSGETIPTQIPDSSDQTPEPPTEAEEPEDSTSGNTGEEAGSAPAGSETPRNDNSGGTTPPVDPSPDGPNIGEQTGSPEQPDEEIPFSDQQDPEKTTPHQSPSNGGVPDTPDNGHGSSDQDPPPSEEPPPVDQSMPDQSLSDEQDQEGSSGQPSETPSSDEQPSSDEETLMGDQDPQETTPGDPVGSTTPDPFSQTDTEPEGSETPNDENADNGENGENQNDNNPDGEQGEDEDNDEGEEEEEDTPQEEDEDNSEGEENGEDTPQEEDEGNTPDDGNQSGGGDDSEVGGGRDDGDDNDDGGAAPIPIPGPGAPPVPDLPGGTAPGTGPPGGGPPAGGGGGQGPAPGSNPPDTSPPENQPDEPEPTATEEPATTTEDAESSTSGSCGSSPTLIPEDLVRRQDLPVQDLCAPPEDRWVVWCRNPNDQASTSAVESKMREVLGPDADIYKSKWGNRIGFFRAQMNLEQVDELETLPDVEQIRLSRATNSLLEGPGETAYKLIRQPLAEASLRSVSQPPGLRIPYLQGNYVYDESAGEGIEVYVVDTGAKKDHIEFTEGYNIMQNARFLTVPDFDGELREDDSQQPEIPVGNVDIGHGTCMLSRIGGHIFGVAKKIAPIIARVPRERWTGGAVAHEEYLEALKRVDQDMGDGKKAIVNISWLIQRREFGKWAFPRKDDESVDDSEWFEEAIHEVLVSIIKKGGYVFAGSGNEGTKEVDGWPARLAKPSLGDRYIPELTVVGAAGVSGDIWPKTNTDPEGLPHIYAPGYRNSQNPRDDMRCAMIAEDVDGDYRDTGATSVATAMVSGLAAYFLKLSENPGMNIDVSTPKLMREFLLEKAWGRASDDLKAIWNGLSEKELPAGDNELLDYCPIPRRLGDEPEPKPSYLKFPPSSNFPVPDNRRKRQEKGVEEEEENLTDDMGMCDPDEGDNDEDDEGQNGDSENEDNGNSEDEEGSEEESEEEPELPELPELCKQWSCPLTGSTDDCKCMDKRTVPMMFTA